MVIPQVLYLREHDWATPTQFAALLETPIDLDIMAGAHVKYVESGDLTELAQLTAKRSEQSPDVKTLMEFRIDTSMNNYFPIQRPKDLPSEITQTLVAAIEQAMQSPEMQEAVERMSLDPEVLGPDELQAFILETAARAKAELQ